jgi:NADP-reducing hydrogenase subunit HndB
MVKLKTLDDFRQLSERLRSEVKLCENKGNLNKLPLIKVGMATCGIASGAKQVMESFVRELNMRSLNAAVTQTGCMGFCYAEPTVEVIISGKEPIVFGQVTDSKVVEIIESYILQGILVDGVIPINYKTIIESL